MRSARAALALATAALLAAATGARAQNLPPFVIITSPFNQQPAPGADSIVVLVNQELDFAAIGEDDSGIVSWLWNFGDGRTSAVQNPGLLSYAAAGRFVVTARATDDSAAVSVPDTVIIHVRNPAGIRIITPAQGSQQRQRFTIAGRATPGGTVTLFACTQCTALDATTVAAADSSWSFPDVQWLEPGIDRFLGIMVQDSFAVGAETGVTFEVVANQLPTASITSPPVAELTIAAGDSIFFVGQSSDPDGTIVQRQWMLIEDPIGTTDTLGWFAFPNAGTFTVWYIATDDVGDVGSASVEVTVVVNAPPVATILVPAADTAIVPGGAIPFAGSATDSDGTIAAVRWDFGDGTFSTQQEPPAHLYAAAGSYVVTFTVTDNLGTQSVPDTVRVHVQPPPVVRLIVPAAGSTQPAVFDVTGRASPGATVRVSLCSECSASGAQVVAAADSSFTFGGVAWASAGVDNTLQLIARSPVGLEDTGTVAFTVLANLDPTVSITQPAGAVAIAIADSVRFVATATDPESAPLVVRWTFAPGDTAIGADIGFHRFDATGTFAVVVRATDPLGAFAEDTVIVTVTGRGPNVDRASPGSADRVDGHDVVFVLRALATQDLRADVNGDGIIDQTDVALVRAAFGTTPGAAQRRTP